MTLLIGTFSNRQTKEFACLGNIKAKINRQHVELSD